MILRRQKFTLSLFSPKETVSKQVWIRDIEAAWVSEFTFFFSSFKFDIVVRVWSFVENNNTKSVLFLHLGNHVSWIYLCVCAWGLRDMGGYARCIDACK